MKLRRIFVNYMIPVFIALSVVICSFAAYLIVNDKKNTLETISALSSLIGCTFTIAAFLMAYREYLIQRTKQGSSEFRKFVSGKINPLQFEFQHMYVTAFYFFKQKLTGEKSYNSEALFNISNTHTESYFKMSDSYEDIKFYCPILSREIYNDVQVILYQYKTYINALNYILTVDTKELLDYTGTNDNDGIYSPIEGEVNHVILSLISQCNKTNRGQLAPPKEFYEAVEKIKKIKAL
ncbi:hypothetical protein H3302_08030 [Pseudoalteromonas sp. MT33b]|uniref:hypothetical protein n=1 Tax=Pseudoalteromonas sp. MT33b TaxID=2759705 RepID=UPI0015F9C5D1|nr:hypothetical protein [Pseudoalteromonas sp. MT33b]QMW15993.1 hypothetical protein H3302_08030 [Pseudoalteromonas sp. MT33b]